MRHRAASVALLLLAGCGGSPAPAPRSTPTATARAAAGALPAPPHRSVRFRATDGRRLHGRFTPAVRDDAPAVVLVHGLYGEPRQWDPFVAHLHRAGFATLAYASRRDDEVDTAVLARDLTGAVRTLRTRPDVDPDRIVLAGASVGGSTIVRALATQPGLPVRGGVGFSALEGRREQAMARRGAFRPHGLLLVSDHREAQNARALRALAQDRDVTVHIAETTGHGVALLADASVRERATAWLERLTR